MAGRAKGGGVMPAPDLTLYFDGHCRFCTAEMARLGRWNTGGRLAFVDITQADFDPAFLGTDMAALNLEVHSLTGNGDVLIGIDSLLAAYTLVGRGWMVFPLRIRLLRPLLSSAYRLFARHRYRISRWLGYTTPPQCAGDVCGTGNPFLKK
jgi:predicted DCC family thiol-disulfide oxidoreductase YuxK